MPRRLQHAHQHVGEVLDELVLVELEGAPSRLHQPRSLGERDGQQHDELDHALAPDRDRLDALASCFPAGTVSGAPKVRAMQIINELEPTRRGLYAGAVGYLDFAGNLDFCIAIRTILLEQGKAYIQAGAGIVADSNPTAEYEETRDKARAMIRALELAQGGL